MRRVILLTCLLASCERWVVSFGGLEETGLMTDVDADTDGDGDSDADTGSPDRYTGTYGLGTTGVKLIGENPFDYAGFSLSSAGDVDGDGYGDLLIGAPGLDSSFVRTEVGATYLVYGPLTSDIDLSTAGAKLVGEKEGDQSGADVDGPGDVDGDGYDDLLIGAAYTDAGGSDSGTTYLVYGPITGTRYLSTADAMLIGENEGDEAGWNAAFAGDVNGDGYDDVLVGASYNAAGGTEAGAAYLEFGPMIGDLDLSSADVKFIGENTGDHAGYAVASAGDVNADGYDDILIGAPRNDVGGKDAGVAYLIRGPLTVDVGLTDASTQFIGEDEDDYAGASLASAGDVNGDGYDDFLIGAFRNNEGGGNAGAAYLILGPADTDLDLSEAEIKLYGESYSDFAGYAISSAGDVDDDGCADVLVGARDNDAIKHDEGKAYLLYGPDLANPDLSSADALFIGESTDDRAGFAVSSAGDVDADGHTDLLLGAIQDDDSGTDAGAAYLILWGYMVN